MQQPPQMPPRPEDQPGWALQGSPQQPYGQQYPAQPQYGQQPYGSGGGPPQRPGSVTAASVLLIILAIVPILLSIAFFAGAGFISRHKGELQDERLIQLGDVAEGIAIVLGVISLGYGVVKLIAGIQVLKPKNGWRVTAIVFASLGAAFWVLVLLGNLNPDEGPGQEAGANAGGIVFSIGGLVLNTVVIVLLARAGDWYRAFRPGTLPSPQQPYQQQGPFTT